MNQFLRDRRAIFLFVVPALAIYLVSVVIPIVWSAVYALYEGMPGHSSGFDFVGLGNFAKMWGDEGFLKAFQINTVYVLIVVAGQVGLGLVFALMVFLGVKRFKTTVRTLIFFPVVLPVIAVGQMFSKMFEITPTNGLVNSIFASMGLNALVQPWLGMPDTALGVLSLMDIWTASGFYCVIFYAALVAVPKELMEAASIDGAGLLRQIRSILLPMIRPVTVTCLVFSLTGTLKVYESALALTRGGPAGATKSLSMYMYDTSFLYGDYGYGSAIAVFILLECIVVTIVLNRFVSRAAQA